MVRKGAFPFNGGVPGGWIVALLLVVWAGPALAATDSSLERDVEEYLEEVEPAELLNELHLKWRHGPIWEDSHGQFKIRFRSRMLMDYFASDSNDYEGELVENGVYFRQARLGVVGSAYGQIAFMLEVEFRNGEVRVFDVFMGIKNIKWIGQVLFGHQREPIGFEAMTPLPFLPFLERAPSTRALGRGRNVGIRMQNVVLGRRLTYWAGLFRETNRFAEVVGEGGYAFTGKITGLPIAMTEDRLLHLELGISLRDPPDGETRYRARHGPAVGPRLVDTGVFSATRELEAAASIAYRWKSFVIQTEGYVLHASGSGTNATFWGGYVQASYWITGEVPPYARRHAMWVRVRPERNFWDGTGGAGAWMVAARFDHIDLTDDGIDGGVMDTVAVGVTWMWNPNARIKADVTFADVEGGPEGTGNIVSFAMRFQWDF